MDWYLLSLLLLLLLLTHLYNAVRVHKVLYVHCALIMKTSCQKLPFGSGDYPDKLLYHQALN